MNPRVLLIGGGGFLGAWIARRLAADGARLRIFDLAPAPPIFRAVADELVDAVEWRVGDVVDAAAVHEAAEGCDAIIALAGLLTPACRADPARGAQVNLIGTLNAFEAARHVGGARLVYTSSAGVYGPQDSREPRPISHYGAFKLATEGCARAYLHDHGLNSIGFRPFVVYGPGRETGVSAGPSLACRAAARGEAYQISYSGDVGLVYVDDLARLYVEAVKRPPHGAEIFNVMGLRVGNDKVIAAIRRVVPEARISFGGPDLGISSEVGDEGLARAFPDFAYTPLAEGVARTIAYYRAETRAHAG